MDGSPPIILAENIHAAIQEMERIDGYVADLLNFTEDYRDQLDGLRMTRLKDADRSDPGDMHLGVKSIEHLYGNVMGALKTALECAASDVSDTQSQRFLNRMLAQTPRFMAALDSLQEQSRHVISNEEERYWVVTACTEVKETIGKIHMLLTGREPHQPPFPHSTATECAALGAIHENALQLA